MSDTRLSYTYQGPVEGWTATGFLVRSPDHATIPLDLANADYQAFLAWLAEGNPAPAGWSGPTNTSG